MTSQHKVEAGRKAWKQMQENLTPASKVYKLMGQMTKVPKTGQPLDGLAGLTWVENWRKKLEQAVLAEGLDPATDCRTAVVYACRRPELTEGTMIVLKPGREIAILTAMQECNAVIVGAVFALIDRVKPRRWVWAYPVALRKDIMELLGEALDAQEKEIFKN
jgi:hypothetical protein